jgi:translation initiation factor 1 (eIF-1/SUI1)
MNPFEEENNNNNNLKKGINIEIWLETYGRKKNTYISGWLLSNDELKEHIKIIKKKNGCNGTIKKYIKDDNEIEVVLLQGDHIKYITKYLNDLDISLENIYIRG